LEFIFLFLKVKITYPIGWRGTEPLYFGALVGGVHLTDSEGHFNYASAIRLTYNVRDGNLIGQVSERWRKKLAEVFFEIFRGSWVRIRSGSRIF